MLKRPKPGESDEDLLAQQEQFLRNSNRDIGVVLVKKNKNDNNSSSKNSSEEKLARHENDNVLLSEIVEKNLNLKEFPFQLAGKLNEATVASGFPEVSSCSYVEKSVKSSKKGESLFLQNLKRFNKSTDDHADEDISKSDSNIHYLDKLKSEIHEENLHKLSEMSQEEILEEQAKLLKALDPKVVEFIKSRRNKSHSDNSTMKFAKKDDSLESYKTMGNEVLDQFAHLKKGNWLHMDVAEPEKFAWMSQIPETSVDKGTKSASSSARFDLEGRLIDPDLNVPVFYGLHHHSDEEHLPGYTVDELIPLCRSALLNQKLLAYRVLTKITSLAKKGLYENIPDLLPKIINLNVAVIVRFGLDDSAESVIQAACGLLAAMLQQPADKEFIYLYENDVDLNDEEFCRMDIISGLLLMNILERLRYILEELHPASVQLVQNVFDVLHEISRHSKSASIEIFKCDRLIAVIREYLLDKRNKLDQNKRLNTNERIQSTALTLLKRLCENDSPIAQQMVKRYDLLKLIDA